MSERESEREQERECASVCISLSLSMFPSNWEWLVRAETWRIDCCAIVFATKKGGKKQKPIERLSTIDLIKHT